MQSPAVKIAFMGDTMLGRMVNEQLRDPGVPPASPWGDTLPEILRADARILNLECALTHNKQRWERYHKVFHFRADPKNVATLHAAGIQAVTLANNHILDQETAGLVETLQVLDAAGIKRVGAGRTLAEAQAPAWLDIPVPLPTKAQPAAAAAAPSPNNQPPQHAQQQPLGVSTGSSGSSNRPLKLALLGFTDNEKPWLATQVSTMRSPGWPRR